MKKSLILLIMAGLCVCFPAHAVIVSATQTGTIERDTLLGVPCNVYLPYKYAERLAESHAVFPVLYLQHGMFGSEDDWSNQGDLMRWMGLLLMNNQVREMIVIMPDNFLGSIPPEEREALMSRPNITPEGEPFNTDNGSAHWRKLTREQEQSYEMSGYWEEHFRAFMNEVEAKYSVSTNPAQRAIAGLSMGGFHTMHVSHYVQGAFGYIGLFSPVIIPRRDSNLGSTLSDDEDSSYHTEGFDIQLNYGSPAYDNWMADLRKMIPAPPIYWIAIGKDDFLYDQLQDYRHWLELNNFEYSYYESKGGHTWANWQDYLCRFMKKIFWDEKL